MAGNFMAVFGLITLLTLSLLVVFFIQGLLVRRAAFQVVRIFRENQSLCSQWPKRVEELGLQSPGFIDRMFKPRDYKPYALQALISAGTVRVRDDGRVCLLEDKEA